MPASYKQIAKLLVTGLWLVLAIYGFYFVYESIAGALNGEKDFYWPAFSVKNLVLLVSILLLMFVNWGIEALKWQQSVKDIEKQSFFNAFKATMVGVSVSTWMPNRLGEYIGKIFYIQPQNRMRSAISGLYVSYTQIIATLFLGVLGAFYFLIKYGDAPNISWVTGAIIGLLAIMLAFLILKDRIINYLSVRNKYIKVFIDTLTRYSFQQARFFIGMSMLRVIVFTCQMVLALELMGANASVLDGFLLSWLIYGFQTIIPATALAGLGIRMTLSAFFLGFATSNELAIISASYGIWMVNLLLPSALGWLALIFSPVRAEVKHQVLQFVRLKRGKG